MTIEALERGQKLLKNIEDYEEKIECVEYGEIYVNNDGRIIELEEDIYREIILAQLNKDLNFLKERFESL